jgi:hypothetical protein
MGFLRPEVLARVFPVLVAALILYSQLIVEPIIGLADNGDSVNVTAPIHLAPLKESEQERFFDYIVTLWKANPERQNSFIRLLTSEWLLIYPVYWMVKPFTGGIFDLRWAGVMHSSVFLWALWLVVPAVQRLSPFGQLATWAIILLALCDVVYFSIFNTFYMDAASFVFLVLTAAFYTRLAAGGSKRNGLGFLIALFLFVTSKLQHAILAPFLVAFILLDPALRKAISWKLLSASVVLMLAASYSMFQHVPEDYRTYAAYNVIFSELLPNSPDPAKVLAEFNLPPEMIALKDTDAFMPNSGFRTPYFRKLLLEHATHGALLRYYLRHPNDGARLITLALNASAREREDHGNFTRASGKPPAARSHSFAVVSDTRRGWFESHPMYYGAHLIAISAAALWVAIKRLKGALLPLLLILACASFEFFVSALGDCKETTRHLFLFRAMMELVLVIAIAGSVHRFSRVDRVLVKNRHA